MTNKIKAIKTIEDFINQLDQLGINGEIDDYRQLLASVDESLHHHPRFVRDQDFILSHIQCKKDWAAGRKIWWFDSDFDAEEDLEWVANNEDKEVSK